MKKSLTFRCPNCKKEFKYEDCGDLRFLNGKLKKSRINICDYQVRKGQIGKIVRMKLLR